MLEGTTFFVNLPLSLHERGRIAISELHQMGFAHQDIRLPNICFSHDFKPVLIDLDTIALISKKPHHCSGSLMYKEGFTADRNDWLQLGLILLWVISHKDEGVGYFDVRRQDLPDPCDPLIYCLIANEEYKGDYLESSVVQKYNKTLRSVLQAG